MSGIKLAKIAKLDCVMVMILDLLICDLKNKLMVGIILLIMLAKYLEKNNFIFTNSLCLEKVDDLFFSHKL